jgi:hypothetical protein
MSAEVEVKLRPTVSRPICLGVRRPSGTCDQSFFLRAGLSNKLSGSLKRWLDMWSELCRLRAGLSKKLSKALKQRLDMWSELCQLRAGLSKKLSGALKQRLDMWSELCQLRAGLSNKLSGALKRNFAFYRTESLSERVDKQL